MPGNFAIRLRCPLCEADSWVTLADRQETYEQIQQQTWEFKCREHGPQTGTPKEVMGVAPLDDPPPCTQQSALAFANPISTEKTKRIPRSSERLPLRIPVVVYGFTKNCGAFHEETETQTVNASGALVVLKTKLAWSACKTRKTSGAWNSPRASPTTNPTRTILPRSSLPFTVRRLPLLFSFSFFLSLFSVLQYPVGSSQFSILTLGFWLLVLCSPILHFTFPIGSGCVVHVPWGSERYPPRPAAIFLPTARITHGMNRSRNTRALP